MVRICEENSRDVCLKRVLGEFEKSIDKNIEASIPNNLFNKIEEVSRISSNIEKLSRISSNFSKCIGGDIEINIPNNFSNNIEKLSRISSDFSKCIGSNIEVSIPENFLNNIEKLSRISSEFSKNVGLSIQINRQKNLFNNIVKLIDISDNIGNEINGFESIDIFDEDLFQKTNKLDCDEIKIRTNYMLDCLEENKNIKASNKEDISLEKRIFDICENVKEKHPIVVMIIVIMLIQPFYECYIDLAKEQINTTIKSMEVKSKTEKSKIKNCIRRNGIEDFNDREVLKEFKFVIADSLNVRSKSTMKSKVLFKLNFSQVVRIIEKDKEWVLIEYVENETLYVKGWVLSKYLSSFN